MATHAVGHDVEPLGGEEEVLVLLAGTPDVGGRAPAESDHASSMTVLPICILSPARMTIGPATFCRLR